MRRSVRAGFAVTALLVLGWAGWSCTRASGKEPNAHEAERLMTLGRMRGGRLIAGTLVEARLEDSLWLAGSHPGDVLTASVTADVGGRRGEVVIPAGSQVRLRVGELGPRRMTLWVTDLTVQGRAYVMHARVDSPPQTVRRRRSGQDVVVTRGTRVVFPLDRPLTVAAR